MKIFQFFYEFVCISSVTEFSKEQNKLTSRSVYHKHYRYKTFLAARLLSKKAIICRNYNRSWRRDDM